MAECPGCNTEVLSGAHFCPNCGRALDSAPPVSEFASTVGASDYVVHPPAPPARDASMPPASDAGVTITPRAFLAFLGGLGIVVGALIDWTRGGSANSFKIPASLLFDWKTQNADPKLGFFLIALGVVCMILAFVRSNGPALVVVGLVALSAAVLYMVQMNGVGHAFGGSTSFTALVGPGAWTIGISGVVLLIAPLVAPRPGPRVRNAL